MEKPKYPSQAQKEFDMAWKEFFRDKNKPENDDEEKKQMEEFIHWYNNIRKQSDTGKTPAQMYKEIYGIESKDEIRIMNFEWDENYDEELLVFIEELKEYDNKEGYKLDYKAVKKKLKSTTDNILKKGVKALDLLHELLENEETWSCLFALEIIKEIKSEKSIPYLIEFIKKNEDGDYFEECSDAMWALVDIGGPAVEEIILVIEKGLKEKIHYCYLFEALSKIWDEKGKKFRLNLLKDYVDNSENYKGWFNLTMFLCDFNEDEKEALPFLKKLEDMDLNIEEKRELESTIEIIEDPKGYKNKVHSIMQQISLNQKKRKIGRNDPCSCGSGKKYKKCCLEKE